MSNAVRAIVKIETPDEFDPVSGQMMPGQTFEFATRADGHPDPTDDLLQITTTKRLNEAAGRFVLVFTPRIVWQGKNWADLIPGYSLVSIYLQHYPADPEPVLVMLGLTGARLETEEYASQQPERTVQVTGMEVTRVFLESRTYYMPQTPSQLSKQFMPALLGASPVLNPPPPFNAAAALLGTIVLDPELATAGDSPVRAIAKFLKLLTTGLSSSYNPSGQPLIDLDLPTRKFSDLVYFDEEAAELALFDPSAMLPASSQLTKDGAPLWSVMSTFQDATYQELFPISRDVRAAKGGGVHPAAVEIIFRRRPFGGRINFDGEVVGVRAPVGSQFDQDFELTETVGIYGRDLMALSCERRVDGIANIYYVEPVVPMVAVKQGFRDLHGPSLDADPDSPSNLRRFGIRLLQVRDYYLSRAGSAGNDEEVSRMLPIAAQRERLLWTWHRFEPLFRRGKITVRGNARLQVGKRLEQLGPRNIHREYYIEGVTHSVVLGRQAQRFVTSLDVTRGWDLPAV